jgi:hypothetical protein
VSATLGERAGVIVVRAWSEAGGRVRARVTATDLSPPQDSVSSAEGVEEIVGLVRAWLERFASPERVDAE